MVVVPGGGAGLCQGGRGGGEVPATEHGDAADEQRTEAGAQSVEVENARRSHDIAAHLDFGTVWVNSHLVLAGEVPWGGFKGSGYGRDLSVYALDDYSRTKHVMHNHER